MARVMNVVTLGLAVLVGCMAHTDHVAGPVEDALAIADQVTTEFAQQKQDADEGEQESAEEVMDEEAKPTTEAQAAADAKNAHTAAATAKQAAHVATNVAKHSLSVSEHAKDALKNAHDALHRARVTTSGLSKGQKNSLKKAEKKLKEATKDAEYGQVKDAKLANTEPKNKELEKLHKKMDAQKKKQAERSKRKNKAERESTKNELEAMNKDLESLRKQLKAQGGRDSDDETIKDLQKQIKEMEKIDKKEDKADAKSHDEMKAEIERLRDMVKDLKKSDDDTAKKTTKAKTHAVPKQTQSPDGDDSDDSSDAGANVKGTSIDIDTAMPYGDLEPFGREDTAQELTESSINESDQMVDQLERAEVAEEKRAVFRALTRLRGAAITSFDGVARSQTGNIDEYNKIHQWRKSHPLHHLADEESDVNKWAFPDNAD